MVQNVEQLFLSIIWYPRFELVRKKRKIPLRPRWPLFWIYKSIKVSHDHITLLYSREAKCLKPMSTKMALRETTYLSADHNTLKTSVCKFFKKTSKISTAGGFEQAATWRRELPSKPANKLPTNPKNNFVSKRRRARKKTSARHFFPVPLWEAVIRFQSLRLVCESERF